MTTTMRVDIVSAEEELFAGEATEVFVSGELGELGIYPNHAALMTGIRPGGARIKTVDGIEKCFYVAGGMLEVQPHMVTILADTAVRAEDIDEAKAQEAKEQAEKLLTDRKADMDYAVIARDLAQALAQLKVVRRSKG